MISEPPAADKCEASPPGDASFGGTIDPSEPHCPEPQSSASAKLQSSLDTLTPVGVNCFDPTRLLYIEALADRAARQPARVAQPLIEKALNLLEAYLASLARTGKQAGDAVSQDPRQASDQAALAAGKTHAGDKRVGENLRLPQQRPNGRQLDAIAALTRRLNAQPASVPDKDRAAAFAEQLHQQERTLTIGREPGLQTGVNEAESRGALTAPRAGQTTPAPCDKTIITLKAARRSGDANTRMLKQLLVRKAIAQCPPDSGPLNPQALIVQSLKTMRDLSPDYLHRLITQLETLNWLEQSASPRSSPKSSKHTSGKQRR